MKVFVVGFEVSVKVTEYIPIVAEDAEEAFLLSCLHYTEYFEKRNYPHLEDLKNVFLAGSDKLVL